MQGVGSQFEKMKNHSGNHLAARKVHKGNDRVGSSRFYTPPFRVLSTGQIRVSLADCKKTTEVKQQNRDVVYRFPDQKTLKKWIVQFGKIPSLGIYRLGVDGELELIAEIFSKFFADLQCTEEEFETLFQDPTLLEEYSTTLGPPPSMFRVRMKNLKNFLGMLGSPYKVDDSRVAFLLDKLCWNLEDEERDNIVADLLKLENIDFFLVYLEELVNSYSFQFALKHYLKSNFQMLCTPHFKHMMCVESLLEEELLSELPLQALEQGLKKYQNSSSKESKAIADKLSKLIAKKKKKISKSANQAKASQKSETKVQSTASVEILPVSNFQERRAHPVANISSSQTTSASEKQANEIIQAWQKNKEYLSATDIKDLLSTQTPVQIRDFLAFVYELILIKY